MMTLDTLKKKIYEGDPIADDPETVTEVENGLFIRGIDDGENYQDHLWIRLADNVMQLFYRNPEPGEPRDKIFPLTEKEWTAGGSYESYAELVHFVYSL